MLGGPPLGNTPLLPSLDLDHEKLSVRFCCPSRRGHGGEVSHREGAFVPNRGGSGLPEVHWLPGEGEAGVRPRPCISLQHHAQSPSFSAPQPREGLLREEETQLALSPQLHGKRLE